MCLEGGYKYIFITTVVISMTVGLAANFFDIGNDIGRQLNKECKQIVNIQLVILKHYFYNRSTKAKFFLKVFYFYFLLYY